MVDIYNSIKKMPISYFYELDSENFAKNKDKYLSDFYDWEKLKNIDCTPDEAFSSFMTIE